MRYVRRFLETRQLPLTECQAADDRTSIIDHFFTKLLLLADTMQTAAGREAAQQRAQFLKQYLTQLGTEIGVPLRETARE
jgi:uncharacterized protein